MCAGCTLYLRKVSKNQLENLAQEGYSQLLQRISERECSTALSDGKEAGLSDRNLWHQCWMVDGLCS